MPSLEYFEVEDRPVVVDRDAGRAVVWAGDTWRDAPALVGKSLLAGDRLERAAFIACFPDADLTWLERHQWR